MSTAIYPVALASPRRDSTQAATSAARGEVEWARPLELGPDDMPRAVLVWGPNIVLDTGGSVVVVAPDGQNRWMRPKLGGSPVAVADDRLYLVAHQRHLQAVDADNKLVLDRAPFAMLRSEEFGVVQMWPQLADVVVSTYLVHATYDEEDAGAADRAPRLLAARTVYGKVIPDWSVDMSGELKLPPLLMPERGLWMVGMDKIHVINVDSKEPVASFDLPMEIPRDWSVSAQGQLAVIGYAGHRKSLVALDLQGKKLWEWADSDDHDRWAAGQPPVSTDKDRVLVVTDGRLLAIEAGRLVWIYDARSETLRHGASVDDGSFELKDGRLMSTERLTRATALGDGSVLLTGKRTLRHIDARGHLGFLLTLPEDILTSPVVDAAGHVYLATSKVLYKIK